MSLFSGILGDDLASEWAGIETVCCVEIDPFCQAVIKKHYPDMPIIGDIHDVTKAKLKEVSGCEWVDIISGGDPCQPRSIAGKRRGREDDRDLWPDMFRVICELKPTWVVNENPTGRLTMDFHEVLSDLEGAGYETTSFVIPACAVNAPHRRDRVYIVAYSNAGHNGQRQPICSRRDAVGVKGQGVITNTENPDRRRSTGEENPWRGAEKTGGCHGDAPDSRLQRPQKSKQQTVGTKKRDGIVADTHECIGQSGSTSPDKREIEGCSEANPHSNTEGLQGFRGEYRLRKSEIQIKASGHSWNKPWLEVATALCGMDDGFPNRVAGLKALGNAQVPQQVYPIYKAIAEVDRILSSEEKI